MTAANKKRGLTVQHRARAIVQLAAPACRLATADTELKAQHMGNFDKSFKTQLATVGEVIRINPGELSQVVHTLSGSNVAQHLDHKRRILAAILKTGIKVQRLFLGSLDMVGDFPPGELVSQTFTSSGVCVLSQSASTAFIRVCQPGPEALNCSTTSESKRTLTCSLVVAAFGRPRFGLSISFAWALPNKPASTSLAGLALAKSLADHSGFVVSTISGLSFLVIAFDLPLVGFTKTDDVDRITPRCEYHDMQSIPNESHRLIPALAVVESVVFQDQGRGPIEVAHQGEWESTFFHVACIFGWVISYLHWFIVPTINTFDNSPRFPTIAKPAHSRYGLPVAANSATDLGGSLSKGATAPPLRLQALFLCPHSRVMAGCAGAPSGASGSFTPIRQSCATRHPSLLGGRKERLQSKGATPMKHALNPSALRALAHRRMALSALRADSSISVRLKRYNAHMAIVRTLECIGGGL